MSSSNSYDPYRNAVRQTFADKNIIERQKKFKNQKDQKGTKSFFQKKIYLNEILDLPEGLANAIFFGMFMLFPYLAGIIFIFFVLANANYQLYQKIEGYSFIFSWVIGYEFIAGFILLIIVYSALTYRGA
jgi:hypothetical protein